MRFSVWALLVSAIVATILACFLAGCTPKDQIQTSVSLARPIDLSGLCLEVKEYTVGERAALAAAVSALPADSPIIGAMGELKRMRDQSRACHKTTGK